jgi:signal transduction histidine kinase
MRDTKGKVGVAFAISDSGIGLTLHEIKRLFRPFSQANVSIASRFGGAGLGLSSVKRWRGRWGATSWWRSGAVAAPPSH